MDVGSLDKKYIVMRNEPEKGRVLKDSLQSVIIIDWSFIDCMLPLLFSSIHQCQYKIDLWIFSFTENFARSPLQRTKEAISENLSF